MTEPATMTLYEARSCRDCIRRHIGPALDVIAAGGTYATCGGCGCLRVIYRFTYWFPWFETGRTWHPSMGRQVEPTTESTLCEECGEEGGNHAGDCSAWGDGLDDGTGRDDELTEFDIGWDWQPPERMEDR